ncbi:MAG: hypothetical protein MI924_25665 [Chloroflexales bacterium]|nr:hypothetical protein [Chloroflexales bacterium]
MLTYENFVATLLSSIERIELNVAYTQELLDTHALGRSLSITCLPDGIEDDLGPREPPLRATITFRWSPEFTVFSLRGGDTSDDIERMVDERLFQAQSGPSLDVEVIYTIPLSPDPQHDITLLPTLARRIQELHTMLTNVAHPLWVETLLSFEEGHAPQVRSLTARRVWSIDEALYDIELLADTFDELCNELHDMLEAIATHYGSTKSHNTNHSDNADSSSPDRYYLKPPTA